MIRQEAQRHAKDKMTITLSKTDLVNKIYNDFQNDLKELRTICKDSIVMCEADGTCLLADTEIMKKINKMIKECE